jgi:hypothetical protein
LRESYMTAIETEADGWVNMTWYYKKYIAWEKFWQGQSKYDAYNSGIIGWTWPAASGSEYDQNMLSDMGINQ